MRGFIQVSLCYIIDVHSIIIPNASLRIDCRLNDSVCPPGV